MYSDAANHNSAYYHKAITLLRQSEDSNSPATAQLNLGDEMRKVKKYDSASIYTSHAKKMFENLDNPSGKAYSLGNMGMIFAAAGKQYQAKKNLDGAIQILEHEDYNAVCDYLLSMSDLYRVQGQMSTAIQYVLKSFKYAKQYGVRE